MQRDPATDHAGQQIIKEIDGLTDKVVRQADQVIIKRVVKEMVKEGKLSLTGKMAALTESAQDFTKETEAVLDGIAEKIALARTRRDVAKDKHHAYYDQIIEGVEESVKVIDRLSNSPLPEDGKS
jgi:uncharacterized protein (DUF488 family)